MVAVECVCPAWLVAEMLLGVAAWWCLARAGVEGAVVGVAIGALALPSAVAGAWARLRGPRGWEQRLQPAVTLGVLPLFAIANAGVAFRRSTFSAPGAVAVFVAVVVARLVGKPLGIAATALLLKRARSGMYDPGLRRRDLWGAGALASVGFTVPLLVISAAFPAGGLADGAKFGVLVGTLLGAVLGAAALNVGAGPRSAGGPARTSRSGP
jgi:NhaA family Na+:H+ antiporter